MSGEIGRGSFVQTQRSEPAPPYLPERPGEVIDLSILKPVCEPMHLDRLKQALGWLSENLPASSALSFRPNMVFPRHRAVAVEWLKRCGLECRRRISASPTARPPAMTVALMSVAPPGSTVATEAIGHHTLVPLATYLGFKLEGLADRRATGCCPRRWTRPAGRSDIRAVFVQPSVINPTATLMSEARRAGDRRGGAQARPRHHRERRARPADRGPAAAGGGTRAGAHALHHQFHQDRRCPACASAIWRRPTATSRRSQTAIWCRTGWRRRWLPRSRRNGWRTARRSNWCAGSARRCAAATPSHRRCWATSPTWRIRESLHVWLPLGGDRSEERFRRAGPAAGRRHRARLVVPHRRMRRGSPAVRISLGSTTEEELRIGLGMVARLLLGDPEHLLLAI